MRLGLIGSPQSGKTTVFNAASGQQEAVGDFSKAVHRALIKVPDPRLDRLADLVKPKKTTHATIEFLDAPGLSGKGKEAGPLEISAELRQADAFMMVIDAFSGTTDPESSLKSLIDEMMLLDQVLIENNLEKRRRVMKLTGDKAAARQVELLERCLSILEQEKPLLECALSDEEDKALRGFQFLSQKPLLIVLNIAEDRIHDTAEIRKQYERFIDPGKHELAVMCGKIEMELAGLEAEERQAFLDDLGIEMPATEKVIKRSYDLLGLISYFTVGEPDAHAWPIRKGTTAHKAAGEIHTDIERGFIRAEVIAYEDYDRLETPAAIKAAGKQRLEGKDYVVKDGDVILFRFNV
jgi:GTP-binding protein YchF